MNLVLTGVYKIFSFFSFILVWIIKLIVFILIGFYFLLKLCFPKKNHTPFKDLKRLHNLYRLNSLNKKKYVLYIDLDETLIYASEQKPSKTRSLKITIDIPDEPDKIFYIKPRPFLEEFLKEASKIFKIYLYTRASKRYAEEILKHIDRNQMIIKVFSRENLIKYNNEFFKDLTIGEKDLSKSLILDNKSEFIFQ